MRLSEHIPIILVAHRATGMRGHRQSSRPMSLPGPGPRQSPGAVQPIRKLPARHPGRPNALGRERPVLDCVSRPSDRRGPGRDPGAAMCVQGIDVQCVLQFTLINAAGCALHRCTSRVIHRSELSFIACSRPPPGPPGPKRAGISIVNRTFTGHPEPIPGWS